MRVLFWIEHFAPIIGGIERSAMLLLPPLQQQGFQFAIVTSLHDSTLPEEEVWQGIPLYRTKFSAALLTKDLVTWQRQQKRLTHLIDTFDPDLVHIFGIGPSMVACLQALKPRPRPLIISLANMEQHPATALTPTAALGKSLLASTWVTTVSRQILDQTVHYLPALASRISVLYSGIEAPTLEPTPLANPPRLLLLGRLVQQKGGEVALAVFRQLYARYPDARLIVAGDGPLRAPWAALAHELGVADRVDFLGWVAPQAVYKLINTVSVVLLPSRWEGLPIVAIESAFMARPTVAMRIPGMDEIVVDGQTGILVEPGNVDAFAQAIAYLLDHPAEATQMGMSARVVALRDFTLQRHVDDHIALYTRLAAHAMILS